MRTLMIAAVATAMMVGATSADAQRLGRNGDMSMSTAGQMSGRVPMQSMPGRPQQGQVRSGNWSGGASSYSQFRGQVRGQTRGQITGQSRWGGQIGGRWYGGVNAPGGWNSYRRPSRGWSLPRYWIAPTFYISDYGYYGLSQPQPGYSWTRYYDDAVMIDSRGRVWDSVSGLDWDGYDDGYSENYGDSYGSGADGGSGGYAYGGAARADGYGQQGYVPAPPPSYGAPYGQPGYQQYGSAQDPYRPAPPVVYERPAEVVQQGYSSGYASAAQSSHGYAASGYVSGGYYYPPAMTTIVTVQSAPAITTTTTEYVDEVVSYSAPRRVYKPVRKWKPKTKIRQCYCR